MHGMARVKAHREAPWFAEIHEPAHQRTRLIGRIERAAVNFFYEPQRLERMTEKQL